MLGHNDHVDKHSDGYNSQDHLWSREFSLNRLVYMLKTQQPQSGDISTSTFKGTILHYLMTASYKTFRFRHHIFNYIRYP